jgi:hypothetical protein
MSSRHDHDNVKYLVRGMEGMSPFKQRVIYQEDESGSNEDQLPFHRLSLAPSSPSPSKFESQLSFEESIPVMSVPHGWDESQLMSMEQGLDEAPISNEIDQRVKGIVPRVGVLTTPDNHTNDIEQDRDWPSAVKRFEQQSSPYAGMFSGSIEGSSEEEASS